MSRRIPNPAPPYPRHATYRAPHRATPRRAAPRRARPAAPLDPYPFPVRHTPVVAPRRASSRLTPPSRPALPTPRYLGRQRTKEGEQGEREKEPPQMPLTLYIRTLYPHPLSSPCLSSPSLLTLSPHPLSSPSLLTLYPHPLSSPHPLSPPSLLTLPSIPTLSPHPLPPPSILSPSILTLSPHSLSRARVPGQSGQDCAPAPSARRGQR